MLNRKNRWIHRTLLALACCAVPSFADAAPTAQEPTKAVQPSAPLTDEALLQMLRGMGYEPYETGTFNDGIKYYWVKVEHDGWQVNVRFSVGPSRKLVWLHTYLGEVPATEKTPSESLRKLLEHQGSSKGRFFINGNKLFYQSTVDNHDLTPAELRLWVNEFATAVKQTANAWNTGTWTQEGKAAIGLHQKIEAMHKKLGAAMAEFEQAFRPLSERKEVDAVRLTKAHERLLQSIQEIRQELKSSQTPDVALAQEMIGAYDRLMQVMEEILQGEFVEIVRIATDSSLKIEERLQKVTAIAQQVAAKEQQPLEQVRTVRGKFMSQHRIA